MLKDIIKKPILYNPIFAFMVKKIDLFDNSIDDNPVTLINSTTRNKMTNTIYSFNSCNKKKTNFVKL